MWCRNCQQDVPAIGSTDDSAVRCARCHKPVSDATATPVDDAPIRMTPVKKLRSLSDSHADWLEQALRDDWELEDELNEAQQLVASLGAGDRTESAIRFDCAHLPNGSRELLLARPGPKSPKRRTPVPSSWFSWCVLSLGMMAFVFGAGLIGWSIADDRPDLWRLGWPLTLGGQGTLIAGLVLQLDRLWRGNRAAAESLDELDSQLDELRHATSLLATTHSSSAQSFYQHMADGASPNLLLADLKGQLDLLASRLAHKR